MIGTKSYSEKIVFALKLWIFDVYIANFYNSVMHTSVFKSPFDLKKFFLAKKVIFWLIRASFLIDV